MRLIDADTLKSELIAFYVDSAELCNEVSCLVDSAKTAETVPVVRCRECKYKDECIRRIEFIGRNPVLEQNTYEYHPLSFCSYGQRKEDDHD